jgi:hypothetical protein
MDQDELLRQCSPEFQEQVKREKEIAEKDRLLQLAQLRRSQERSEMRTNAKAVIGWLFGAGVVLSMIYWAIKFIKWAWYN